MSKPKLEFKKVKENGVIPTYGKAIMPGYDGKEYGLCVPEGQSITLLTDEPCVIPLGITAEIPEGWHVVFRDAPMTRSELSFGEDNEWILTVTRQSPELTLGMGSPISTAVFAAAMLTAGLSIEETKQELDKPRRVHESYTLDGRITFIHLEEDE